MLVLEIVVIVLAFDSYYPFDSYLRTLTCEDFVNLPLAILRLDFPLTNQFTNWEEEKAVIWVKKLTKWDILFEAYLLTETAG